MRSWIETKLMFTRGIPERIMCISGVARRRITYRFYVKSVNVKGKVHIMMCAGTCKLYVNVSSTIDARNANSVYRLYVPDGILLLRIKDLVFEHKGTSLQLHPRHRRTLPLRRLGFAAHQQGQSAKQDHADARPQKHLGII